MNTKCETIGTIRILAVDNHALIRSGIEILGLVFDDLKLVGEASSGEEALQKCAEVQPDVVLIDIKLPKMNGLETTKAIRAKFPQIQVLFLTSFCEKALIESALQAGAIGYLLKDTSKNKLAEAIRSAYAGLVVLAPAASQAMICTSASSLPQTNGGLTPRQQEVLMLLKQGLSNAEIATQLKISVYTARHYVSQILIKLKATNRTAVIAQALEMGLVK